VTTLPIPETAKWEEIILKAAFANAKTQLDIAILAADSLGKKVLTEHLQQVKAKLSNCELK